MGCAKCVLLLGDSRDRYLYHDWLAAGMCHRSQELNWSHCQGLGPLGSAWVGNTSYETVGGVRCQSSTGPLRLRFLAYLQHWGVAGDHYHSGWPAHRHDGWGGKGWDEAGSAAVPHSPSLIIEGTKRFLVASQDLDCERHVLFSSYLWDLMRPVRVGSSLWGQRFGDNFSKVVRALKATTDEANATLHLTLPFPVLDSQLDYLTWRSGMFFGPVKLALYGLDLPLIDLSRPFLRTALLPHNGTADLGHEEILAKVKRQMALYRAPSFVQGYARLYRTKPETGLLDSWHQSASGSMLLWAHIGASIQRSTAKGQCARGT